MEVWDSGSSVQVTPDNHEMKGCKVDLCFYTVTRNQQAITPSFKEWGCQAVKVKARGEQVKQQERHIMEKA